MTGLGDAPSKGEEIEKKKKGEEIEQKLLYPRSSAYISASLYSTRQTILGKTSISQQVRG
jgi:hypothetical protein